ncbi:50S ribosomal protein L23 [Patescibacteria group bacterium]|nr:50S ribosomal protein L23 [Patescibacteria group bacterium]
MIYLKPLITEKSLQLIEKNWYSFIVPKEITKPDMAEMISVKYGKNPLSIVAVKRASIRKRRGRNYFASKALKIIRVKMPEKVKIDGFEVTK